MSIDFKNLKGFSLIELLVTLIIVTILIGIISTQFPVFNKLINRYSDQSLFKENYLVFLSIFSKDFYESELYEHLNKDVILFKLDLNFDSDYKDATENISYRWNTGKSRIERKSGKGNFQVILDGVDQLKWEFDVINEMICLNVQIKSVFSIKYNIVEFCRPSYLN
ncbi:MAG: prepilin-type N-terminal cleavage/methylation domain-containing protein [Deltaproteobacteria bacterium]|jgi:prepilin-type N-terminal cleavage/methylation domain-containing protein|nr:prepilin-type N-terminal cleavage/methylation domain-containing protein [Deltaproteobacteria bacterium]MBT4527768.1 prepilin-type N-terminal cleavage/methylation domain-containing protein [Deltaproteobacteria bacterium]